MKNPYTSVLALITIVVLGVAAQEKVIVTGASTGFIEETGVAPARLNIINLYEQSGPAW